MFRNTLFIIIGLIMPMISQGQKPFTAEMINTRQGNETIYRLRSDGDKYRYDFEDGGMKGAVIVDPVKGLTAILMPDKKFVHFTDIHSSTSLMNDPVQAFLYSRSRYEEKQAGKEKISGYNCIKSGLYASGELIFTAWYSEELGFLVKLVNEKANNTNMELSNIKEEDISTEVLNVPGDYTEVDKKMRPLIPEPQAPESWKEIKVSIPVKGVYKRGDVISFVVPESTNYKIILNNSSGQPAKIIRTGLRDGKELPDKEQGPPSYRTKRLHGGESSSAVYSWKAGDIKNIQVHEGVINIEIVPE